MFEVHSCFVVSAWPVPMYLFWSDSSCCCVRSLSAWQRLVTLYNEHNEVDLPF